MKLYIVVTEDHYNENAPAERKLNCEVFTDKTTASVYKNLQLEKYSIRQGWTHIRVTMFEKEIEIWIL